MLYLIEDRDYLKIGYTNNIKDREKTYKLHNCYAKVISLKEGTLECEQDLHELCKEWHYQGEWFHNVPKVKQIFEKYNSFNDSKFIWLKKIVSERYVSLLTIRKLPYLSNKDFLRIKNLRKEVLNKNVPKNISRWIAYFDEQEKLMEILNYLKWAHGPEPNKKIKFLIFPETTYDITNDIRNSIKEIKIELLENKTSVSDNLCRRLDFVEKLWNNN